MQSYLPAQHLRCTGGKPTRSTRAHARARTTPARNNKFQIGKCKVTSSVALNIDHIHISFYSAQMTGAEYEDKSNL